VKCGWIIKRDITKWEVMLPNTDEFLAEYDYIHNYGEKRMVLEFMEYEKSQERI
jgi:hypothetical protein